MLHSERLFLRPYEIADAKNVLVFRNDPEVRRFLVPGIPYPLSVIEEERWIEGQSKEAECKSFAIILKETGEYIGGCGFNRINWQSRVATIGIFLGQPFWNKGLGTEAVRILIEFAFGELNVNKIKLQVFFFQQASDPLLRKKRVQDRGCLARGGLSQRTILR